MAGNDPDTADGSEFTAACPFSLTGSDFPRPDPYPLYRQLRDRTPIFYTDDLDGYWVATRYDDVFEAGRDWEQFSSAQGVLPRVPAHDPPPGNSKTINFSQERERARHKGIPLATDPPEHAQYRRLISKFLGATAVAQLGPAITRRAEELLDAATGETFDVIEALAGPLPGLVLAEVAGLPEEDHDRFQRWSSAGEFEKLHSYIGAFMDSDADDGIFGALRTGRIQGRPLSRAEQVSYGRLLLVAGHETTTAALGFMIHHLCEIPGLQERLRQDPSRRDSAVEEFLRYEPPVQGLWRTVTDNIEWGGCPLREGDQLLLLWGSANRDERHFPEPDVFDEQREPNDHIVFGSGRHRCIGQELARAEMRAVLDLVLARFSDVRLADNGRVQYSMSPLGGVRGLRHLDITVTAVGAEEAQTL